MKIERTRHFEKAYKKLSSKVQIQAEQRTALFLNERNHPLLKDHALHGRMNHLRAFSVTGDYRIIYEERRNGDIVFLFLDIGRHGEVYY